MSEEVCRNMRYADLVIGEPDKVTGYWFGAGMSMTVNPHDWQSCYWWHSTEENLLEDALTRLEDESYQATVEHGSVPGHPEYRAEDAEYDTIEPGQPIDGVVPWWRVHHSKYPESSVLAGQDRHVKMECYYDLDAARVAHPDATVQEYPTLRNNYMSQVPPSWFDPAAAGERWSEDDC